MRLISAAVNLLLALFVMLALGVANGHWKAVPALGYWETYLLVLGISSLAGAIHGGMRVKLDEK